MFLKSKRDLNVFKSWRMRAKGHERLKTVWEKRQLTARGPYKEGEKSSRGQQGGASMGRGKDRHRDSGPKRASSLIGFVCSLTREAKSLGGGRFPLQARQLFNFQRSPHNKMLSEL